MAKDSADLPHKALQMPSPTSPTSRSGSNRLATARRTKIRNEGCSRTLVAHDLGMTPVGLQKLQLVSLQSQDRPNMLRLRYAPVGPFKCVFPMMETSKL